MAIGWSDISKKVGWPPYDQIFFCSDVQLYCGGRIIIPQTIAGGVGQEILQAYQENNSQLTDLSISDTNLENGGDRVIGDTLRSCRNLQKVYLTFCGITAEQLLPIADAIRGHRMLEELNLRRNNIGNVGCDAIATLLADPNSNLRILSLTRNAIDNKGATTIANSLRTNNKLQHLHLVGNQIDQSIEGTFCKVLCNTSSIGHTYAIHFKHLI